MQWEGIDGEEDREERGGGSGKGKRKGKGDREESGRREWEGKKVEGGSWKGK